MRVAFVALLIAPLVACSNTPKLVPAGGECFYVTDCAPGLICVKKEGTDPPVRECSTDVASTENALPGMDGGARDAATPIGDAMPQPITDASVD